MLVVENQASLAHDPRWVFHLGGETYRTRDVPSRVDVIRRHLEKDPRFEFIAPRRFPQKRIHQLHPYADWIKNTSRSLTDPAVEIYPDLFPGEGANLPRKKSDPLWGGLWCTDAVTPIKMRTYDAAKHSAETALTAAKLVADGKDREVYAMCRPSGHHAGPRVFGGYCYFNNCVLAADLLAGKGTVATLDIDFHHGNGTQEFFQSDPRVFTASIHADPSVEYPYFWGYTNERGIDDGEGTNRNFPLPLGATAEEYLRAVDKAARAIRSFGPDFLVISAGFDTHKDDPIGGFALDQRVYPEIGKRLAKLGVPTTICQEGGYRGRTLGGCVHAFLSGFLNGRDDTKN
ncbi:MAG: histone deacetylase family protein [Phycisphaerae bacterium]